MNLGVAEKNLAKNYCVDVRLMYLAQKLQKSSHSQILESGCITLVAAAGFEPTTFGL